MSHRLRPTGAAAARLLLVLLSLSVALAALLRADSSHAQTPRPSRSQRPAPAARPTTTPTPIPTPTPLPSCCLPATTTQYEQGKIIYQEFPSKGPAETAWGIVWSEDGHRGLWIEGAWFWRKKPFTWGNRVQVLGRAGLSNVFVPYHTSFPAPYGVDNLRFFDLHHGGLHEAIPQDAGECGTISGPLVPSPIVGQTGSRRVLVKEIRDRGVIWTTDRRTRRGEEMLLWGTYDAGNYEFVIQYGFRDDGTVTFRLGSTGYNSPTRPFEAHMHNALWQVDVNLATDAAGPERNKVWVMKHVEPASSFSATDSMSSFNNGLEGFADWNDKEFTHLNISNTVAKNSQGHNISYDLMPMRTGSARHAEDFSQHDFWVTLTKPGETEFRYGFEGWNSAPYVNPPEQIADKDVTLWYISSNHHLPRDEDHEYGQPIRLTGVALLMWSGFDLHPRNLFDDTPLHTPPCAPVPPDLVGWWPFEEQTGATGALDIQGNPGPSLNGTPLPAAVGAGGPSPVTGVVGGAFAFDGSDDYVQIPDTGALDFGSGDFSIDAWIKTTQNTGNVAVVLDKRQPTPLQGYHLFTYNGSLFLQLAVGGNYQNYPSNVNIADGNWHHVAVTVDRTNEVVVKWYVDGLETSKTLNPVAGSVDNSAPLRLGRHSFSQSGYWKGEIDEVEIFKRALRSDEVFAMYSAGRVGKCQ
jgi:hypothetical protein